MIQRGFEEQVKPLIDQLDKLKGIPVPDFGPLDDWAANRSAEQQHKARRAAGAPPVPVGLSDAQYGLLLCLPFFPYVQAQTVFSWHDFSP